MQSSVGQFITVVDQTVKAVVVK